MNRRSFKF